MASHPPQRCCTIGVVHEGKAKGEIKNIGKTATYFSYPESKDTSNAILLLTDVIGHEYINAQLVADQFAANGYYVIMPDLFEGDPVPLNRPADFDIFGWLTKSGPSKGHTKEVIDPIIEAVIKDMKENQGVKRIGAVGYCFGGKYVARFQAKGRGVDVGYTAHPSFVDADEIKAIAGPISIAAAETDQIFPAEKRRETEDILKDMTIPYQMTLYSDVEHGFALRGDISKPPVKFAKEAAFLQAVAWFDEYLKGNRSWASPDEGSKL